MNETIILCIYFGMMPVITFIFMVIHKAGYVDMIEQLGGDKIVFGYPITMVLWPLIFVISIIYFLLGMIFVGLSHMANRVANKLKK